MAWSEAEAFCRKHPEQIPQPGVCPSCLRERLSRITGNSSRTFKNSSCSSSSPSVLASPRVYYYCRSSGSSSGGCSPPGRLRGHHRIASDIMDSIYLAISGSHGLTKSRSMAYAPRKGERDYDRSVNAKKKGGFWNKLLLLRSTRNKAKF